MQGATLVPSWPHSCNRVTILSTTSTNAGKPPAQLAVTVVKEPVKEQHSMGIIVQGLPRGVADDIKMKAYKTFTSACGLLKTQANMRYLCLDSLSRSGT